MAERIRSRRERPSKPALSRDWIIAETIEIMRTEGLEKATMRRVAQALDTGPASLYVYIANTAELHSAVLDELLAAVPISSDDSWEEQLEATLRSYSHVLYTYPGLARSALSMRPSGRNALRLYDHILGLLIAGGIAADRAAWGMDLLLLYVTANAAEHSPSSPNDTQFRTDNTAEMNALARTLRSADPSTTPHIAAHADAVMSGQPSQRVGWAIRVLIAGIASTPLGSDLSEPHSPRHR